jgi:hypothetical protein
MLKPGASPRANRLARPPPFPEIFEVDEGGSYAFENNRCQSPTPVTHWKKSRSTSSASQPQVQAPPSPLTSPRPTGTNISTYPSQYRPVIAETEQERDIAAQHGLIMDGSGNSSSGSHVLPSTAST